VGGEKGGVGKSFFSRCMLDYFVAKKWTDKFTLIEADPTINMGASEPLRLVFWHLGQRSSALSRAKRSARTGSSNSWRSITAAAETGHNSAATSHNR
ncbi:MAG: hypothetical protein SV583_12385, partial [Pseudomonadota bacterium]|nr:hypothetical protein [Pseudomonadota bacterium]